MRRRSKKSRRSSRQPPRIRNWISGFRGMGWTTVAAGGVVLALLYLLVAGTGRYAPDTITSLPASPETAKPAPSQAADESSASFLDEFSDPNESPESSTVLSDKELESKFRQILADQQHLRELRDELSQALQSGNPHGSPNAGEGRKLAAKVNVHLSQLDDALKSARQARPDDPVVQWLTGELLMSVGGEPKEIIPYFEQALDTGLERPRLLASLARVEYEGNHFARADQLAHQALEADNHSRYVWDTFTRVELGLEHFDEVLSQQDDAFAEDLPAWAEADRNRAAELLKLWQAEQRLRQADAERDDCPRVLLQIAHRRFRKGEKTIETAGQGEVILELFEDQAPATVANFLTLVEQGFYDGTLFHLAQPGHMVVAGDPKTKNGDPSDDGDGGPGYAIPDEWDSPQARNHFRGSLSMLNRGPGTAGSQFFITLVPHPRFNGHYTVFGRVIAGQDVVDRITPGRTSLRNGVSGKVIPGDLIVHAEVLRKRPHEYRVEKLPLQRKSE